MLLPIADFSYPLSVELLDFKPFRQLTRLRDSRVGENAVKLSEIRRSTGAGLTHSYLDGWLVGCFGLNGPLRQYFSLYWAVFQREGERKEK